MSRILSRHKAPLPTMPANTSSKSTSNNSVYTNLHLSALIFRHPPASQPSTRCPCEAPTTEEKKQDSNRQIRVYHNEPSGYTYNSDCYLIKESRFSTSGGWHSPSDDLVADDAAVGSPVVAVGRWQEGEDAEEVWKVIPPGSPFMHIFSMATQSMFVEV